MHPLSRPIVRAAAVGALMGGLAVAGVNALRNGVYEVTAKALSAEGAISADGGGFTYSIPLDVAWQDAGGTFHEGGRPACLPPSGKEEGPVRFKAVAVDEDGLKFRQVYFVECI
ncbi:MAG: hypothetical protein LC789_10840 [Actinobacteria bacterium]|nr:hypothetical protein [Actinomycetota bacterium]MCA1720915.1 hypothetical protein [Actinomycetota bacterium]